MDSLILRKAQLGDIRKVAPYLIEFKLDTEDIVIEQFVVAEVGENMAGFGRIKSYSTFYELASVGVISDFRKNGVGEKLVKYLIETCPADEIWISTKIADYFRKFGFKEIDTPPDELIQKTRRVCESVSGSIDDSCYMLLKKTCN
ncbi:MAG TPA: hypothetical protein DDX14_07375 [Cyanobacteria bacterium UBA9579]|nr:hypothetical protein [Cyanobacteria bacterium UBA9579]